MSDNVFDFDGVNKYELFLIKRVSPLLLDDILDLIDGNLSFDGNGNITNLRQALKSLFSEDHIDVIQAFLILFFEHDKTFQFAYNVHWDVSYDLWVEKTPWHLSSV